MECESRRDGTEDNPGKGTALAVPCDHVLTIDGATERMRRSADDGLGGPHLPVLEMWGQFLIEPEGRNSL